MNDLPPCILRARLLLRAVDSIPGAEHRVYQRIVARPSLRLRPGWRFIAVACSIFLVGSGAYGLGLLPRLEVVQSTLRLPGNKPSQEAVALVRRSRVVARVVADAGANSGKFAPLPSSLTSSELTQPAPHASVNPVTATVSEDHRSSVAAAASAISAHPLLPSVTAPAASPIHLSAARDGVTAARSQPTSAPEDLNAAPHSVDANRAITSSTNVTDSAAQRGLVQSELGRQTADYRDAVAIAATDPNSALDRLMRHRATWPRSAILHEVDLRIITTLLSMGRDSEARAEARRFLRQHPRSPQTSAIQRIAGENRHDTESVD